MSMNNFAAANGRIVNRQGVGSVDGKMVDEAIARKARLILERAGIAAEDQVFSFSKEMKNK
jgi:citrate lyase beta subunit